MKNAFCYLPENQFHHLDHLLPLAIELDLPLITRCEAQCDLINSYYGKAQLSFVPPNELIPMDENAIVISTLPRYQLELEFFLESRIFGPFESVFCPHGLSDKELLSNKFQELSKDRKVLLYGEKMKREVPSYCHPFYLGNYRKHHFEANREHYLSKLPKDLKSDKSWKLLWAPTWIDNASQIESLEFILERSLLLPIPEEITLIFKPHPNLIKQIPSTLSKIKEAAKRISNLVYLEDIPTIYPLFEKIDAYLGDTSSIGYDFLTTSKPAFTLVQNPYSPWHEVALKAALIQGRVDWNSLLFEKEKWHPRRASSLLEQSFAETEPLKDRKKAFSAFLAEKIL